MRGRLGAVALVAACSIALAGAQAQAAQPGLQLDFYSAQGDGEQMWRSCWRKGTT